MSFALDLAHVKYEDATLLLTSDLDRILGKLFRADPALLLGRGAGRWEVIDVANRDTLMFFTHDAETAVRFMEAYLARVPGSSADWSVLHSWRVAQQAIGAFEAPYQMATVHPLVRMLEQTDEAAS